LFDLITCMIENCKFSGHCRAFEPSHNILAKALNEALIKKLIFFIIIFIYTFFADIKSYGQSFTIHGKITDTKNNLPLPGASVEIFNAIDSSKNGTTTDTNGLFLSGALKIGKYYISVNFLGYETYKREIVIRDKSVDLGDIHLNEAGNVLNEVKIVEKILAIAQKDDTTEYNAGAYKTNPDADAADLVKKMPALEINSKEVKAQGETVVKVLVDGKPFLGTDPYASLRNLPAEIIDKVQVYNEKSEQEQFTGFSEGTTTKTINIITKPDKRNGAFGKVYAGYGDADTYTSGGNLNTFKGDRRITLTAQSNNVNVQNFGDQDLLSAGSGSVSVAKTNAIGINYTDKWGKKADIGLSYFFNESDNEVNTQIRKTFVLPIDSGQVYNDTNNAPNTNYNHRFNLRLNYAIDSMNSVLFQPQLSLQKNNSNSAGHGVTEQSASLLNETFNNNTADRLGYNFSGNLLFRHRFHKKGRTFSLNMNIGDNHNEGTSYHKAQNIYYDDTVLNNSLNQQSIQAQNTWSLNANASYTEPIKKTGLLQFQYNVNYIPANSDKNTNDYSYVDNKYSLPDSLLSNTFSSRNIMQKAGGSYQYSAKKWSFSCGLYYQVTELNNEQKLPYSFSLNRDFGNILPVTSFHYKITKTKNLQCSYNTNTRAPSVGQLQNVVNNNNPLQLSTGNPDLKQPYQHNLSIRYNATNIEKARTFSASITGAITQNNIASQSIIAQRDTIIQQNILLARGSQLTIPVNIDGNRSLNLYMAYGLPLKFIKSHLNLNMNAGLSQVPSIINNESNFQNNKTGGLGISIGSNISENVDFTLSSNTNVIANNNSLNANLNNTFINQNNKAVLNLIFWKGFVLNTDISYQHNSGLSAGYNQDYVLWNMSFGKKLFKKRQGDLRFVVYDILQENKNIQHSISDIYIQDTRSNVLTRYYMLVFMYKIREYRK